MKAVESPNLAGLKVFTVGLLIAIGGFVAAVAGLTTTGWVIGWGGAIIGLLGMALHLMLVVKNLFDKRKPDI